MYLPLTILAFPEISKEYTRIVLVAAVTLPAHCAIKEGKCQGFTAVQMATCKMNKTAAPTHHSNNLTIHSALKLQLPFARRQNSSVGASSFLCQ